jgi:hypothetical protein
MPSGATARSIDGGPTRSRCTSLPGLMSLLSLIDPASTTLWRISFAIVAAGGVLALALVRGPAPTGLGAAAYVAAVVLYVLIALVAVAPGMVADLGVLARPLRVEAVLLTMLVFLGGERRLAAAVCPGVAPVWA